MHNGGCGVSLPSLSEFWSVVTHPNCEGGPSTAEQAFGFTSELIKGGVAIWSPGNGFGERLLRLAADLRILGVRIFDLQIAVIAFENGASELWTHDAGFLKVPGLIVKDPFS
jgi:predicted nucleic acid-binding protein